MMAKIKFALASTAIAAQAIMPVMILYEFMLRGGGLPMFSVLVVIVCVMIIVTMKDGAGRNLFSSDRISKFGPFFFYSFKVLRHMKE